MKYSWDPPHCLPSQRQQGPHLPTRNRNTFLKCSLNFWELIFFLYNDIITQSSMGYFMFTCTCSVYVWWHLCRYRAYSQAYGRSINRNQARLTTVRSAYTTTSIRRWSGVVLTSYCCLGCDDYWLEGVAAARRRGGGIVKRHFIVFVRYSKDIFWNCFDKMAIVSKFTLSRYGSL